MNSNLAYQVRLHLIVLIFGFTGILGKLIELPASFLVLYRMIIASIALALFLYVRKTSFKVDRSKRIKWLMTGIVVGVHWFFFFESIKVSTVSVALVSLSCTTLFTSVLEPLFHKKNIKPYEIAFSVLIIIGMVLVLRFEFSYWLGILYGIISAFLASLFTVLNSRFVAEAKPSLISLHELIGGGFFVFLLVLFVEIPKTGLILPTWSDLFYLLVLGIVATAVAFVVSVQVMKKLSAFTVSLSINLEPLYGIILAVLIFGQEELMSAGFYIGFALILSTILLNAYFKRKSSSPTT